MGSVPVIDVSGLYGSRAAREAVAAQIDAACREIGFFCITGHGVSAALIEAVRRNARAFFARPLADRMAIEREPPAFRGYIPLNTEGLARSTGDAAAAADLKEAWSMGPVTVPAGLPDEAAAAHFAPNRWPAEPAGFHDAFDSYYRHLAGVAGMLLGGFALALGLPEDWFADKVDRHISNVRALHYPPQEGEVAAGQIRAGAHTDYGCLTILLTEPDRAGLQVRNQEGLWEDVPHVPGSFVVNIGDLMAQWSNDRYVSTLHRVANPERTAAGAGRLSIAFFHQPNHDAAIACIPGCAGPGNPARYAPITSGDHRLMKVRRANAMA